MSDLIKIKDFFSASNHKLIIRDIISTYHHRWDTIGEAIQNAVDAVLKRAETAPEEYKPTIKITYNLRLREIMVEDNGVGISPSETRKIAAPHFSLKSAQEASRGEFGVGLTLVSFSSNDFHLESVNEDTKSSLTIKNGYGWAMDQEENEDVQILFHSVNDENGELYAKIQAKPVFFQEYTISQLRYILRRYTAIGDFWSCYKKENGSIYVHLSYIDENGTKTEEEVPNVFWHPADFFSKIGAETVDYMTVQREMEKGKEHAMPNWIGFGLTEIDKIEIKDKEFPYYALFCRAGYYKQLAEEIGLLVPPAEETEEEIDISPKYGAEILTSGIYVHKKGMPLGATVEFPRTAQIGYWRNIFIAMNCDSLRTEPGRKKLHVADEEIAKEAAKKIFYKLTKFSHYIIPRDPDEEMESLLRNVEKNIQSTKYHRETHELVNPITMMRTEPINEQTLIGLFHELIGAGTLSGYRAIKLSATETYDGIYEYNAQRENVGKEHWQEWLRTFNAKERREIEESGVYSIDTMIIEFKLHLEDVIKDFLQKTKYHPHIKLIVAWDANNDTIRKKGWLLEELPQSKQKFFGANWRLRPSSEGQTRGILGTDVLLLKQFLSQIK